MQLIEEVLNKSTPISIISKKLDIKLSTAKLIVKKYKEEGCFFEKRSSRLERLAAERELS
jgi:transposase